MITEWIVTVALYVGNWFLTLIPTWPVPSWFTGADATINQLFSFGQGLAPFVPWGIVAPILGAPLALWCGGLLFKLGRIVVSHIPFFGGR